MKEEGQDAPPDGFLPYPEAACLASQLVVTDITYGRMDSIEYEDVRLWTRVDGKGMNSCPWYL